MGWNIAANTAQRAGFVTWCLTALLRGTQLPQTTMRPHHYLPSLLLLLTTTLNPALALENLPAGVDITEDTPGQVTINGDPTGNATLGPDLPISATIFSGVPGPSACRGRIIFQLAPPPVTPGAGPTAEACYNLPGGPGRSGSGGGCGVFTASKEAGCQARLFAEPGCRAYVNTAVFIPEERAVGGAWRSVGVRCGVPAPDPESLGPPPLAGLMRRPGGGRAKERRRGRGA